MSQENKNIQPPSDPPTQKTSSEEKLPFWKASLVKALRGTIGLLETTAVKLETEPSPSSEEKPGFFQKFQQVWIGILGKIRLILPAKFSAKLSDTALTGILGGLVLMVFLIASNVFDSKPSQVVTVTPDTEIPPVISTTEPESIVSEEETIIKQEQKTSSQQETASLPTEEETVSPSQQETSSIIESQETLSQKETIAEEEQETPAIIESQETLSQKETPSIIESKETLSQEEETASLSPEEEIVSKPEVEIPIQEQLQTTPPPTPLTPEQTLIAAIQNQVAEISNRTFSGIIKSIQANFLDSNLTIKISDDWYSLEKSQQDKLAAEILQRSQELDFSHLEITDLQGKLIARNPVVGTEMIIFKRK